MQHAAITGWGIAVPERVLTNADLEQMVETSDDWIVSRTGIRERRVIGNEESTTSLAVGAAHNALAKAGRTATEMDLIIVATATPDDFLVSQAALVQAELGGNSAAFDIGAACAGFVTGLSVGTQFLKTGVYQRALIIGVDTLTRYIDWADRTTCVLFGDGAGAVVVEASSEERGLLSTVMGADGAGHRHLNVPGNTNVRFVPESASLFPEVRPYLKMNGREVFKFAVNVMGDASVKATVDASLSLDEIDLFIPHQANVRILDAAARKLNIPREKFWMNLDRYGNTSAASVPMALAEAADAGALEEGSNVVLVSFGAGLAWAAGAVRWGTAGVVAPAHSEKAKEPSLA